MMRETVCVCVGVCVRVRERERSVALLIICLPTCHYHSKSVLVEEISLELIAHAVNLKYPSEGCSLRFIRESIMSN